MQAYVLNSNFEKTLLIDNYKSFIWTKRYNVLGDFELHTSVDADLFAGTPNGVYLQRPNDKHLMVVERHEIDTNIENGEYMLTHGRSIECILDRRIVWKQTDLDGDFQSGIKRLINENVISPTYSLRKIPNFVFKDSTDPIVTGKKLRAQYTGDNLLKVITDACKAEGLGFQILLNDQNQLEFQLYSGVDRSYSQSTNPYVVFSPNFENLLNSKYSDDISDYRNAALVAGEGEGAARKTWEIGAASGFDRRELYVDARGTSQTVDNVAMTDDQYHYLLGEKGWDELAIHDEKSTFEGEVEATQTFIYGRDFFLGDIVQIRNEFGMNSRSRVVDLITSHDTSKNTVVPKFEAL